MKFMLSKKDIISLNKEFDLGNVRNDASLDFALSYAKRTENWIKALAFLVRAILLDHVFEDGNKRTAALLIYTYADIEGYDIIDEKLVLLIKKIIIKRTSNPITLEEKLKNVIRFRK